MLEHADDNARANTLFFSIHSDDALATRRRGDKLFPRRLGNGKIGCPFIGFYLVLGVVSVGFVDKDAFLAVKQDFHCFMEGAEPEVIIGLVPGVQLDDGLPGDSHQAAPPSAVFRKGCTNASATPASLQSLAVFSNASTISSTARLRIVRTACLNRLSS